MTFTIVTNQKTITMSFFAVIHMFINVISTPFFSRIVSARSANSYIGRHFPGTGLKFAAFQKTFVLEGTPPDQASNSQPFKRTFVLEATPPDQASNPYVCKHHRAPKTVPQCAVRSKVWPEFPNLKFYWAPPIGTQRLLLRFAEGLVQFLRNLIIEIGRNIYFFVMCLIWGGSSIHG